MSLQSLEGEAVTVGKTLIGTCVDLKGLDVSLLSVFLDMSLLSVFIFQDCWVIAGSQFEPSI